jgi:hypothetical protein
MRILHVLGKLDYGGVETWLVQVLRHIVCAAAGGDGGCSRSHCSQPQRPPINGSLPGARTPGVSKNHISKNHASHDWPLRHPRSCGQW